MFEARDIRTLDNLTGLETALELYALVEPDGELKFIPVSFLLEMVHHGALAFGAVLDGQMVGFVFGYPGLYQTSTGVRPRHCSRVLVVHPDFRARGIGFALKRAQWQMARHQGIERITWSIDPLAGMNAFLDFSRLGAVSSYYTVSHQGTSGGFDEDRLEVDWWITSQRVERRLSRKKRLQLDLAHYFSAGAEIQNPTCLNHEGHPVPAESETRLAKVDSERFQPALILVEIPSNFQRLSQSAPQLSIKWREHIRVQLRGLFQNGYIITDFIHLKGETARSFYVLSHGNATL